MKKSLIAVPGIALLLSMALPVAAPAQMQHGSGGQMHKEGAMPTKENAQAIEATGVINTIDASARSVNLSHEPIPAIGWPAMKMDMKVADDVNLSDIEEGQPVTFTLERGSDNIYMITGIETAK